MFRPLWPTSTEPKFIDFRRVINFLERSAFWDSAIFCLENRVFRLLKTSRYHISKTKGARPDLFGTLRDLLL